MLEIFHTRDRLPPHIPHHPTFSILTAGNICRGEGREKRGWRDIFAFSASILGGGKKNPQPTGHLQFEWAFSGAHGGENYPKRNYQPPWGSQKKPKVILSPPCVFPASPLSLGMPPFLSFACLGCKDLNSGDIFLKREYHNP